MSVEPAEVHFCGVNDNNGNRLRNVRLVGTLLLATGCASVEPYDPKPAEEGRSGVLWTRTHHKQYWSLERGTYATVSKIDGTENRSWRPQNLTPGRHSIEVTYDRESYACGYLGCMEFEEARRSFDLVVEPGHSYMPFARRLCDKDWIGILDTGSPAGYDIARWRSIGDWSFQDLKRLDPGRAVVAGDSLPASCDSP